VAAEDVDQPRDGPEPPAGGTSRSEAVLSFPDLPRLELDQLLAQLVERAQEVMGTQGRLRGLLRANHLVTGDLSLPAVLRRIVDAARELVDAQYAAIGVVAPGGGLAEFVHSGMPEDDVARIGHLPEGKGLLGALLADPAPIRLRRIADDSRSAGFPPGHPPMDSFLGVPIRVREEVFGRLYLSESGRGQFSAEDEELLTALAATAGVAIENARLYESARSRGEWLQASAAVTRQLLSDKTDADATLQLIAERSRDITEADVVAVLLPAERDGVAGLQVRVAVGEDADGVGEQWIPLAGSVPGRVFIEATPVRLVDVRDPGGPAMLVSPVLEVGPVLAVPLLGSRSVHGVLWAARLSAAPAFTAVELEMAGSFANHAAVAIELAEARAEQHRVAMLDERERIAADLHDHVIQRLFAAGLSLQSIAMVAPEGATKQRLSTTIQDLDDTISQIRTTIFRLQQQPAAGIAGVRSRLLDVLADVAPALGFDPALRLSGVLEDRLADDLVDDLFAVLREALTNVARHAKARRADVAVVVTGTDLTLQISDDGVGIGATTRRSGLVNMRRRAEQRGGALAVTAAEPTGTRIRWSVPLA
jgi:signal transduction histidine kinase